MSDELEKKVIVAQRRIADWYNHHSRHTYIGHSGGKDSCTVAHLALMMYPWLEIVHNTKDTVNPGAVEVLYNLAKKHIVYFVPVEAMESFTRSHGLKIQLDGSRKAEATRTDRSPLFMKEGHELSRELMGEVAHGGHFGLTFVYPIFDWTDEEVWEYLTVNRVEVSSEYGRDF